LQPRIAGSLVYRALVIAACVWACWHSVRFAAADWVASANTVPALEKAVQYSPNDPRLVSRLAIAQNEANGQDSGTLKRAAAVDPLNSEVLMTLGLREEFEGDRAAAERELTRATEIDRQFKPAWTLANYYARAGEPAKVLPVIERLLRLEPLDFDLGPVFDLCWQVAGSDPARILNLIPKNGRKPAEYLAFLIGTKRTDEALRVWPIARDAGAGPDSAGVLTGFVDFLVNAGRTGDAVMVWNQLVDRGIIHSGHLDPAKSESVADPGFEFPAGNGFAWHLEEANGVSSSIFGGALRVEMRPDDPESFGILDVQVPLLPGRRYRLVWKSEGAELSAPQDTGFRFRVKQSDHSEECPPLLTSSGCDFSSAGGDRIGVATLSLGYTRAQGTIRASGTLGLKAVHLEFIP
jgi:hypothetical protein